MDLCTWFSCIADATLHSTFSRRIAMAGNPLIDPDELMAAIRENVFGMGNDGFCIDCGHQQGGCEPDARMYPCESCDHASVYGAEELLLMGYADDY